MRFDKLVAAAVCALTFTALAGCAATGSPGWDERFGDSLRTLKAQQLIDPNAPARNAQATPPTSGRTAREAAQRHVESYREPPPTNIINIGVGGGRGSAR